MLDTHRNNCSTINRGFIQTNTQSLRP
uniref:Uncharacterized protein n=1 Tax=Anguilla anguilla TaxID=7936 RepID=A0A0E9PLV6_ANGAN